jgi:hypothetical protein
MKMALSKRRLISSLSTIKMAAGTLPYSSKKGLAEEGPTSKGVVIDIFPDIDGESWGRIPKLVYRPN